MEALTTGRRSGKLHALIKRQHARALAYPKQGVGAPGAARHATRQTVEARLDRPAVDSSAGAELESAFKTIAYDGDPAGGNLGANF